MKKMLALVLVILALAVLGLSAVSLASPNDCEGPVDTDCHQGHDAAGNPTDPCAVYVDLGNDPPGILCLNAP